MRGRGIVFTAREQAEERVRDADRRTAEADRMARDAAARAERALAERDAACARSEEWRVDLHEAAAVRNA